jgi:hypothetical protein
MTTERNLRQRRERHQAGRQKGIRAAVKELHRPLILVACIIATT